MSSPALTPTQRRLVEAMRSAVASGVWRAVPNAYGYTIAWDSEERDADEPRGGWVGPYRALVFLSLVRKPVLGVSAAPWMGRRDQDVTYRRAFEVLADPEREVSR